MHKIIEKRELAQSIKLFVVEAPLIAAKAEPGHFVVVRVYERGERIPLTIADHDKEKGTITLVVQEVGKSTKLMGLLEEGDSILDIVGPLGKAGHLGDYSTVACVGGGLGTAPVLPYIKAYHEKGAKVISFIGAQKKDLLILRDEVEKYSDKVYYSTDDGSFGHKGFVTDTLKQAIESGIVFDEVIAIGPVPMMRAVSRLTKEYGIKTVVSLNAIMIDGTGMCGGCRVTVGGEAKFSCVDGPEFDGHLVDFDELMKRQGAYREEERISLEAFEREGDGHRCRLNLG